MEPHEIVNLLPDPETELRYRRQLAREAYDRGVSAGYHDGYETAVQDLERNWQVVAAWVKKTAGAPTNAELQERRAAPPRPTGLPEPWERGRDAFHVDSRQPVGIWPNFRVLPGGAA